MPKPKHIRSRFREQRSEAAQAYRPLYWTARWRRKAKAQLSEQPLCERCLSRGIITPATVAHHKQDHKGDPVIFWEGELESACAPCHDGEIQREAHGRVTQAVGLDGWPI